MMLKIRCLGSGARSLHTKVVVESFSTSARNITLSHAPDWIMCRNTLASVVTIHEARARRVFLGGKVSGFSFSEGRLRVGKLNPYCSR